MMRIPEWVLLSLPPGYDFVWHNPRLETWIAVWANPEIDADSGLIAQVHSLEIVARR